MEFMKIQNELENEKLKQRQWQEVMDQLKQTREHAERAHSRYMQEIKEAASTACDNTTRRVLEWFRTQTDQLAGPSRAHNQPSEEELEQARAEQEARDREVRDLQAQQEEIANKLAELTSTTRAQDTRASQNISLEQLKTTLSTKKDEDPNKLLLKALITNQNKAPGDGGICTLRPSILNSITGAEGNNMAEWLANLNKQDEGESEIARLALLGEGDPGLKSGKARSGILDKATTNIQQKQVWPQQNLGEDWADEEVEFKQIKFEHLVAGETRTIETCSDPAQILGRLRLMRRMAYLKLRRYEWSLIRKMYAAIVTSIETKEYSWESNFDRFETILYRRTWGENRVQNDRQVIDRESTARKRFCQDYNKPEGCPKNSPHVTWFRNGPSAVKRTVYHLCAACLIREKQQREHPEGHPECPHRA